MSNYGMLMTDSVARVYSQALFELATDSGQLEAIAEEVEQLGELLASNRDLAKLVSSRTLRAGERAGVIDRIFKGRVSDTLYRFLQVVNHKGRLGSLRGIVQAFGDLMDEHHGIVEVDAYVAQQMDDDQVAHMSEAIAQAIGRKVVLHQYVDPQLIGGLKIRIGDRLIDGSVAAQLKMMKQKLVATGREQARQLASVQE